MSCNKLLTTKLLLSLFGAIGFLLHVTHLGIDIYQGKCDEENKELLENVLYGFVNLLQGIELLVFTLYVGYYWRTICREYKLQSFTYKTFCETFCHCCSIPTLFVVVYILLPFTVGVVISGMGYGRDKDYNASNYCGLLVTSAYDRFIITHAVMSELTIIVPCVVRIIVIVLLGLARKHFKDSLKKLSEKLYSHVTDEIDSELEARCQKLSYGYRIIGKKVQVIYKALEAWFMLQFIVYSVLLTTDLIHVLRPVNSHKPNNDYDRWRTILYLIFDLATFLLPYLMAVKCNEVHSDYYKALLELYQNGQYKCEEEDYFKACRKNLCCCQKNETGDYDSLDDEPVDGQHSKYYVRSLWKKIEKKDDLDFRPNLFGASIPISSPIYTCTLILSLFGVISGLTR